MTQHSDEPPIAASALKRSAGVVGGGLGCLALIVGLVIVTIGLLAIFLDDPTFWIAVVAFVFAVAAYKTSRRGR